MLADGRCSADAYGITGVGWVARLAEAHHAGRLQDELVKLGRVPLLIIDLSRPCGYAEQAVA